MDKKCHQCGNWFPLNDQNICFLCENFDRIEMPKIIITTSDNYLHILPIFCFLYNKYWGDPAEIVGYREPEFKLPDNFTFRSLGVQSNNKKDFSNDLAKYFSEQDNYFVWMMEDTFIKRPFRRQTYMALLNMIDFNADKYTIGRINLTGEGIKQDYTLGPDAYYGGKDFPTVRNTKSARYRLSTQPSIWCRDFLLKYLTPNLSPWEFETQDPINDGWDIIGMEPPSQPLYHNEGVRRFNIYEYDFNGIDQEVINEMKQLKIIS